MRPLLLLLALACACKSPPAQEPTVPLPTAIATLPVFEPAALGPAAPRWATPAVPLMVVDHVPHSWAVDLRFNQPVAAQDLATPDPTPLLRIDPPVRGRASWVAPDHLRYTFDGEPPDATRYRVHLASDLRSQDGQPLADTRTWTFETDRPQIWDVDRDLRDELPLDAPLVLVLDHPVDLASLSAHLTAHAHAPQPASDDDDDWHLRNVPRARKTPGTRVPISVRVATKRDLLAADSTRDPAPELYTVRPATRWPAAKEIELILHPGLVGTVGPLPTDTAWATRFTTPRPQALESSSCTRAAPCGLDEPVVLRFRNEARYADLERVSLAPRPEWLSYNNYDPAEHSYEWRGRFAPGVYTVRVPPGLQDIYGQPTPPTTRQVWFVQKPDLTLSAATGVLPPDRPHVGVEAHMLRSVRVQLGVYDEHELTQIPQLDSLSAADLARLAFPARTRTLTVPLTPQGDTRWTSHALDLAALTAPLRPPSSPLHGAVLVEVTPLTTTAGTHLPDPVRGLYRVTDLTLVAHASPGATVVRALHLSSGTPAPGVAVCRTGPDPQDSTCHPLGTTDRDGLLRTTVPRPKPRPWSDGDEQTTQPREHTRLVASLAADRTHLDIEPAGRDSWRQATRADNPRLRPGEHLLARLVRERGAYRPGERVHLVGWAALDSPHTPHNLAPLTRGSPVTLTLTNGRDVVARATARTSAAGKFSASLDLPARASLGSYTAVAELVGERVDTDFKVEDYRPPEFAVTATPRRSELLLDEQVEVDVRAAYFFGAPVALTDVTWRPSCQAIRYTPPNLEPGWTVGPVHLPYNQQKDRHASFKAIAAAAADPPGQRTLAARIPFDAPTVPHSCSVFVYAQDASAQGVGADARVTLHPADIYVAMHAPAVAHPGDRVRVALRALTRDGDRVAQRATVHIKRIWEEPIYKEEDGLRWQSGATRHEQELPPCSVDLTAVGPDATCTLTAGPVDSTYALTGVATRSGRKAESSVVVHVIPRPEPRPALPPRAEPTDLELHIDRTTVRPGERVEVVVRGPWNGARGQLLTARRGVHEVHPFTIKDQQATIVLTADDTWTPSLELVAHVFTPAGRHAVGERRTAAARISQPADHRRLQVAISAPREAGPGDRLPIAITVRDPNDRPVAGRVAVWAVDEAVLSLTDERLPDLLHDFLPATTREVDDHDVLRELLDPYVPSTIDPDLRRRPMFRSRRARTPAVRSGAASVNPGPPGPARSRFVTTPLFLGDALVDATGTARVTATLPDNLTTFRITAIASADLVGTTTPGRFGGAEARVLVTSPLVVRAAAPRQLRPGDIAELAALVDNRTDAPGQVHVEASLIHSRTGPDAPVLEFMSETTGRARVPAHGQVRVPFKVRALSAGTIDVKLSASLTATRNSSDAVQIPLPVAAEPTQIDRAAIHGELTANHAVEIPIKLPRGVLPGHGGLDLRAGASQVAGLDDAARALVDYPYGCLEQTASRLVPLIALQDLQQTTPPDHLDATLERLATMQTRDGFAYWPGEARVHPFASAYTTWLLQRAASAGLPVPKDMLTRALASLEQRLHDLDLTSLPPAVQIELGVTLAPALHALADAGKDIDAPAALLFERRARLPLFTRASLLLALHRRDPTSPAAAALADELLANLSHGPDGAHAVELLPHGMDEHFHSDARSDAMVLLALLSARPDAPALTDLARGLQSRRPAGAWRNTQENAWAILALAAWARVREPADPDIHARAWLAGQHTLDAALRGRDATTALRVPMADLLARAATTDNLLSLVLERQGTGPLHYRLALDWAPAGDQPARDQGLAISRQLRQDDDLLAADDFILVGNSVAVDLELRTHQRVRYVAVDVPIPAGLEPVQLTLGKGQAAATGTGTTGTWFTRQELRPDRVLLFIDDLPPGLHRHTVHLRATSRGRYAFPPAHAEAMYIPELYGRSSATKLEVR